MQLKVLARALTPHRVIGTLDREVESIAYDSRRVQSNTLFVASRGEKSDGHQFVDQAIEQGASVIVAEREIASPRATCLVVDDSRGALADLSAVFYGMPAQKLKMAAVTGTNGKTTTTFLIKHICEKAGVRCGLLGTVQYEIGDRILPAIRTTPEALDIQELLAQIVNAGGRAAAMEVSSHALAQDRTRGIEWDVAVFTNLTQDHLDYHRTMENYFQAKKRFFSEVLPGGGKNPPPRMVINADDPWGQRILREVGGERLTYGLETPSDIMAEPFSLSLSGIEATL